MTETAEQYARINEKYHARRAGNPRVPKVPLKLAHRATLVSHSEPDEMAYSLVPMDTHTHTHTTHTHTHTHTPCFLPPPSRAAWSSKFRPALCMDDQGRTLTRNDLSVTRALENPELDAHTRANDHMSWNWALAALPLLLPFAAPGLIVRIWATKHDVDDVPCQPQCRRDYSSRRLPGDVRTLKLGSRGDGIDLSNAPWILSATIRLAVRQRCYLVVHKRLRWLNGLDQGVNDATDGVYVLVLTFAVKIQEGPATTCRGTGLLSPSRPRYPSLREDSLSGSGRRRPTTSSPARASGGGAPSLPAFPSDGVILSKDSPDPIPLASAM
ncbi:hypothetical protein FA13DRAFT_1722428 [Coprinellus micaceus]|uniref:Uncharacterized protein n=1 Tax=Coprinellus micaceus TaxID=71717 RepID=A0A4Y7RLV0_COPMI|nr:hypothetical protein FA13DRAFT_1722428 [Coprinellus micaceus]